MKEKLLSILRAYQKEFVISENKITIGNFSRRAGKSTSQIIKVLYEQPRNVYFINNFNFKACISRELKETMDLLRYKGIDYIKSFSVTEDVAVIQYNDNTITKIYNYVIFNSGLRGVLMPEIFDMAIFNECLPTLEIKAKKYISTVTMRGLSQSMYPYQDINIVNCGLKEIVQFQALKKRELDKIKVACGDRLFRNEIDINDEYEQVYGDFEVKKTLDKFIGEQIEATIKEYESLPKNQETLHYRNHLLTVLRDLQRMKEK